MANTIIQIKRSTETAIPTSLEAGELAFTSNGDSLWIGSPSGSNTANVVHIGSVISYTGNSTQLGETAGGSNTELASTYAIKGYVDGRFNAYSTDLAGLDDVSLSSTANNEFLVFDAVANTWENHSISGTSNEIVATFTDNNLVLSLPDNLVAPDTLTVTANLVVSGTANIAGETHITDLLHINRAGAETSHFITQPTLIATANVDNWTQVSIQNYSAGVNASADFIAYPNNTASDDNTGFIDMGITGNGYNQAAYSVTTPNDGYLFASARANTSLGGSLVLATDSTGTNNDIKFFTGGFTYNDYEPHMVIVGAGANKGHVGINNASPTSQLSVGGDGWFNGNVHATAAVTVGDTVAINTSIMTIGNTTVNTQISAANIVLNGSSLTVSNGTSTSTITDGALISSDSITIGNSTVNVAVTPTAVTTGATIAAGNTTITGFANVSSDLAVGGIAAITGTLSAGNTTITGDLTVTGTVTTIDTQNIVVEDSLMRLARNQANTDTYVDAVDIGFYGIYGNTSQTLAAGFARESASNNFVIFVEKDPTGIDNDGITTSDSLGTLYTYLQSSGLSTSASAVTLTANSTVSVGITANTLSLTTALAVASGGTGNQSFTNNQILLGNGTGALGEITNGSNGQVLQITGNVPTFGGLDGGTF